MHERRKLARTTKPATATTPPVHGDEVIGELYNKNIVLIPITIDPFARFGPMFQSFLTSTESRPQEPWFTTHRNNKFNRPYVNLMYERASKPPSTLGILTSADFFWKQSGSPTRRTFYGNSYTAPTPSIHTIKQLGLAISKSYRASNQCDLYVCSKDYQQHLNSICTAGFTIFPTFVALVTKKTYVECTKYVRRNTPATASSRQPQTTNKRTMAVASRFCGF
jgi:hypothetical protein